MPLVIVSLFEEIEEFRNSKLMGVLGTNANWSQVPAEAVQEIINDPRGAGERFTQWLCNRGRLQIVVADAIVDLDADAFMPPEWKKAKWQVEEHRKGGKWKFDPGQINLVVKLADGESVVRGHDLRTRLKDTPVFNANLLDFLLANPHLIPEAWKGKAVFFWGTVYRAPHGSLCVRCLYWRGERWGWRCYWLDCGWGENSPAAALAS